MHVCLTPVRYVIHPLSAWSSSPPGVTGQSIPPAGLHPGLKRPRLDYTRVYYGLGQYIPPQAKVYAHYINRHSDIHVHRNYLSFQKVTKDSVLSGKFSEKAKLTELKS